MILRGQRRDPSRSPKSPLPDNHHHYHHHHFCHHIVIIEDKDGILHDHQKLLRLLHIHDRSLEDGSGHQVWSLKSQLVDNSDGIDHLFNDNGILWRVPVLFTAVVVHLNMLFSLWSSNLETVKNCCFQFLACPWNGEKYFLFYISECQSWPTLLRFDTSTLFVLVLFSLRIFFTW